MVSTWENRYRVHSSVPGAGVGSVHPTDQIWRPAGGVAPKDGVDMAENWVVIAEADSPEKLKNVTPSMSEIPSGSEGIVTVEFPWYLGGSIGARIFDMAGAEQTIGEYLKPAHSEVIDVYESGGKGHVKFRVIGTPAHLVIGGIALGLIALGVITATIVVAIKVPNALDPQAWGDAALKYIPLALIGLAAAFLLSNGGHKDAKDTPG